MKKTTEPFLLAYGRCCHNLIETDINNLYYTDRVKCFKKNYKLYICIDAIYDDLCLQ